MIREFKLPDLGEGVHEGEILAVRVAVGQAVREGEIILEVETDKAAVEIPSPFTGTVAEIRVRPGQTVRVGEVLITFATGEKPAAEPEPPAAAETGPALAAAPPPQPAEPRRGPVPASPATRRLARELGVDLAQVPASGPAGLVTAEDVRAFAARGRSPEPPPPSARPEAIAPLPAAPEEEEALPDFSRFGPVERVPFRSLRRATARRMALSWARIPHVTSFERIDVTRLEAFRRRHKAQIEAQGGRLTLTVFALKAAASVLKAHPRINASLDEAAGEIVLKKHYHLGVAVNTAEGLIVPVVREVDNKSLKELAVELKGLVERAHARKLSREELQGGTFTITNAGALGGWSFTPIIQYPQAAILGLGEARLEPVIVGGRERPRLAARLRMPAVLSIDHRLLDGADAVGFLNAFRQLLEDPDELLLSLV